jgi:hypothetical protein
MFLFSTLNSGGSLNPITSMEFNLALASTKKLNGAKYSTSYPIWSQNQITRLRNVT